METIFTTHDISESRRISAFKEVVKNHFLHSYDCQHDSRLFAQPFYANLARRQIDDLCFLLINANGHHASSAAQNKLSDEAHFYIEFQRSGNGTLLQDGRNAFLRQGDFVFCDMARPLSWRFEDDYSLYKILIPRDKLAVKLGDTRRLTSRAIRSNTLTGGLVYSFLLKFIPALDSASPESAKHLSSILLDLIIAAIADLSYAIPVQTMSRSTLLYKAQQYIESNLRNPNLKVEDCAKACGVSVRYLQELFHEQDTSVSKWLWEKRLELYKASLINPLMAEKNFTQIAYDCGFSDISNLSRKFKAHLSVTPSCYRKMHMPRHH